MRRLALGVACSAVVCNGLPAQQVVRSMGQPPRWESYVVPALTISRDRGGVLVAGVHHPITNPVTGLFGIAAEASLCQRMSGNDRRVDPGARLLATSRVLGLSAGVSWDARTRATDALVSYETAMRRGGLLGRGTMLRVDWLPARDGLALGVHVPLGQPYAGRTRNRDTDADLPRLPGAPLVSAPLSAAT